MNCHLLVPDLFWPAAAGGEPCRNLALPALETILARGHAIPSGGISLERWLAASYALANEQLEFPLAPFALRGDGGDPGDHVWMHADPVHLKVHGDRLILAEASRLTITEDEARGFIAALNSQFAPEGIEFTAPHPQRWYVRMAKMPRLKTTPTAEAAGRNVDSYLPAGDDGARWRKIFNEAQMLLHAHPHNAAREARGTLTVNSVWFWGAGRARALSSPYDAVWASHPLPAGLAAAASSIVRPLPSSAELFLKERNAKPALVVAAILPTTAYGDIAGWRDAVTTLEQAWCAPLLTALKNGTLQYLTLHGLGPDYGYCATLERRALLRFWRRRRPLHAYAA
jgi:hypothetical protein